MEPRFERFSDDDEDWLSDIETRAIDLQGMVSDWRQSRDRDRDREQDRERGRADQVRGARPAARRPQTNFRRVATRPADLDDDEDALDDEDVLDELAEDIHTVPVSAPGRRRARPAGPAFPGPDRTRTLIKRGRPTADPTRRSRTRKRALWIGAGAVALTVAAVIAFRPGPSWPASVSLVKSDIATACQNPNVASEPDQVNFACDKDTSQILWVFSLLTSNDNPAFADAKTGRKGLEPITPTQGGEVAWSLDLHHPYNPYDPVDSLTVAARAINNIIGGATLTSSNGSPSVQPGLESNPSNCARYTGSSALVARAGYPSLCAQPVTSVAGEAALVSDVYQAWFVGSPSGAAQDAAVLFENANDPGNPQVQAILKTLSPGG
jgi:hypothetical protein